MALLILFLWFKSYKHYNKGGHLLSVLDMWQKT